MKNRLLRVDQVAEMLNVSCRTVYRLIGDAQLQVVPIRGGLRVYESSILNYVERQTALHALENGICANLDHERQVSSTLLI